MTEKKRTLLVGIDAACWEYLDPLLADDRLPNIKLLMNSGVHGSLGSPMPPMTPVAWSSIVTGKGPAKHGVYEWVRRKEDTYEFVPYTKNHQRGTPFWKSLADYGIKVGLVNVPFTYPPMEVDGFVVCGFGAPESAENFTNPPALLEEIELLFGEYRPTVPIELKKNGSVDELFEAERLLQEKQVQIAVAMAAREDVDVLVINLMFPDHANHYFADIQRVEDAIILTDSHLGLLIEGFLPDTVLLISDHGSRRLQGRFLFGAWLSDHGYQSRPDPQQIVKRNYINWLVTQKFQQLDWPDLLWKLARRAIVEIWMQAPPILDEYLWKVLHSQLPLQLHDYWCLPNVDYRTSMVYTHSAFGCLYLNVKGREPDGLVSPDEQEALGKRLVSELSNIIDPNTGKPLFSNIYLCDQIYSDSTIGQPPDFVLDHHSSDWGLSFQLPPPIVPRDGYYVRGMSGWYGEHSSEGIYVFSGADILANPDRGSASLLDIPTTLLYLHGVPIPEDYDGRVMVEVIEPVTLNNRPVSFQSGDPPGEIEQFSEISDEEAQILLDQLRDLGYVE